jgi:hypothetical protein
VWALRRGDALRDAVRGDGQSDAGSGRIGAARHERRGDAIVLAIAAGSSVADDLAIVSVVRLRSGVFDEGFFRSWRDSYDEAACDAAGGVSGHAEAEIGGRTTFIGTCAGGAHTYHVRLETDDVILVSVTAVGERRLGEQVVAGLTE